MKNNKWRVGKPLLLLTALVLLAFAGSSCRNNEVAVPPLTGPSGHRLFITIQADPDHLVIHAPNSPQSSSQITIQLKNQLGVGVPGENVKLRITNINGSEIAIGSLNRNQVTTDAAGFGRVTYTAPDRSQQPFATQVYILAVLTNPAYVYEVTDIHKLDLELPGGNPGCASESLLVTIDPQNPTTNLNETLCFTATVETTAPIISAQWNFGDGRTANGLSVCHEYTTAGTFTATLVVQDNNHDCGSAQTVVTVGTGTAATCNVTTSPSPVFPDDRVNFNAVVTDPDGVVNDFFWSFGDGGTTRTTEPNTTHRYREAATYSVLLTITDDQGNVGTCTTSVSVTEPPEGQDPTCSFSVSPADLSPGDTVNFNASASTDADGRITRYTWDFGDGSPLDSESDPLNTHVYDDSGTFTVTLVVRDNDGNTAVCSQGVDIACADITVNPASVPPGTVGVAYAQDFSQTGGAAPITFSFSGSLPPGLTFTDNPNDTATLAGIPGTAGTFQFSVTATDANGCTGSTDYTITINP
jgi:PKD repeat protein